MDECFKNVFSNGSPCVLNIKKKPSLPSRLAKAPVVRLFALADLNDFRKENIVVASEGYVLGGYAIGSLRPPPRGPRYLRKSGFWFIKIRPA
jgi:hypothetical protein